MSVILVRHAKASHNDKYITDETRPLTKKGKRRQFQAAIKMSSLGLIYNEVWVSPILRARQTYEIIDQVYQTHIQPTIKNTLLFTTDPQLTFNEISQLIDQNPLAKILIIGHNPHITELLSVFISSQEFNFRTSEVAWLQKEKKQWKLHGFYTHESLFDLSDNEE